MALQPLNTSLDVWADQMRLGTLVDRNAVDSDTASEIGRWIREEAHPSRFGRMVMGLYLAFISVAEEVLAAHGLDRSQDPLTDFARVEVDAKGRSTKTLTFRVPKEVPGQWKLV